MKNNKYRNLALGLLLTRPVTLLMAQPQPQQPQPWQYNQPQSPPQGPVQQFNQQQLATLVAPIALYPDALLSQVLIAATYPMELQQAAQWLQANGNLGNGPELVNAAAQQPWDASIQALVVFPDVVTRLTSNMQWTTDLGNAFIAQEGDVMNAVQTLRAQARANGRLVSTPQQQVITQDQGDQSMIEIQPSDPEMVYVPNYNPEYVWGAPAYGYYYPGLYYPSIGVGFGFGYGISIGRCFGGLGWGGWGWHPNWYGHTVIQNGSFFSRYRFNGYRSGFNGRGSAVWAHNPEHRLGVPYSNRGYGNRPGAAFGNGAGRGFDGGARYQQSAPRFNNGGSPGFNRGFNTPEHRPTPNAGARGPQNPSIFGGGNQASPGFQRGPAAPRGNGYQASPRSFGGANNGRPTPSSGFQASPNRGSDNRRQNGFQASPRSNGGNNGGNRGDRGAASRPAASPRPSPSGGGGGGSHGHHGK